MRSLTLSTLALASLTAAGCTGQLPGSFRLAQQEQTFSSKQDINTKIDLLWVVDNSASMDVSQQKLRDGFAGFARKYMQPTWDIRVAVITTDTYMSNPAFSGYLNTTVPLTPGWGSTYITGRLGTFVNPSWNTSLVNLSTGKFDAGVKFGELVPAWGPTFGRLLPGLHDGPIAGLCSELLPYFLRGLSLCGIRDNQAVYNGPSHCLSPDAGLGESSVTQCVNTVENDTIHSGKAIISTMPPAGTPGDAAWTNGLINDFTVNVTTGSVGQGSERGLGSVLQLLNDNEPTATAFFRPGSLRGIIFVSDEEDQTMVLPSPAPAGFKPQSHYMCDQASLVAMNGAGPITGVNGLCCSNPANNCSYGAEGTACPAKTVDGFTYTVSTCPRTDLLVPVSDVKSVLDAFFLGIDGSGATVPNYFISSIVPLTGASIQAMQATRNADDTAAGAPHLVAVDRGDRYLALGDLVGNGSLSMDIAAADYSPLLDAIGQSIIQKKSSFTLDRAPTGAEDMIVKILHADGSATVIPSDKFVINGNTLTISDYSLVLGFAATDQIVINYQPKTVF